MNHVVILAAGDFPKSEKCLGILRSADAVICCDSAAAGLVAEGLEPYEIVGDMDSIPDELASRYSDRIVLIKDQETNDQTKAFGRALLLSPSAITILGATGRREDHTLSNISLLIDYSRQAASSGCKVEMVSDYGRFVAIGDTATLPSVKGQEISIFCFDPTVKITSAGLDYPTDAVVFDSLWKAALNVASGNSFKLTLSHPAGVLVFFEE